MTSPIQSRRRHDRPQRLLLHCHDSFGLGHLRRTLTLAGAIAEALPDAELLITTGSPCASHFALPEGVELLKLPAVTKDAHGRYAPRSGRGHTGALVALRRRLLLTAFRAFDPDLVLVDHQPLGLEGELVDVLQAARATGTRTILGIRDVIDGPEEVAAEWGAPAVREALASLYDRVLVYGTPEVFDPRVEYPIPAELSRRLEFTGYVVRPPAPRLPRALPSRRPDVLVTMGGGEDGADRIELYLELLEAGEAEWDSTIVLGPLLPARRARELKRRARALSGVDAHVFHADLPRLLARASAVVAMAGYNTVAEILQQGRPAVLLPRTHPRREQLIRAQRLEGLDLVRALVAPTRTGLAEAVAAAIRSRPQRDRLPSLEGAAQVARSVAGLATDRPDAGAPLPVSLNGTAPPSMHLGSQR